MSFTEEKLCRLMLIFILSISINVCYTQITTTQFRSSNIEIVPDIVITNSTSITNFTCINHEPNDLSLEVKLSKIIPSTEIEISTSKLNASTLHIQLEAKNYVGIFHLLCFSYGKQNEGNRADIIVKAAQGVLQLAERCRVYDRQYIKCVIRAPILARAIQNDYPPTFEFKEINLPSDQSAYLPRVEFIKNESTIEHLVFKWKPTVEGEFPNGVRMHMKAILPYFNASSYYFDMTPVFRIKPQFLLQAISSSEIQINLTSTSPPAFCEKTIVPKLISNINQTWTVIESDRNNILINNLVSKSIYRVCIKCRQIFTDPDGTEECQEIKTFSKFNWLFDQYVFILIIMILIIILFISFGVCFYFWRRKPTGYIPVDKNPIPHRDQNIYVPAPIDTVSTISMDTSHVPSVSISARRDTESSNEEICDDKYLQIALMADVIEMCSPPKILYLPDN